MRCKLFGVLVLVLATGALGVVAAPSQAAPNDPLYPQQANLVHLHVPDALAALVRPLAPTIVAIPDTGISHTNPDLGPALWSNPAPVAAPNPNGTLNPVPTVPAGAHGWNSLGTNPKDTFPSNANPGNANTDPPAPGEPDYSPDNGHGTFIAGIAGATANNGVGLAGIAPNAKLMALRTCWEDDDCYQSINAPAFNWAAARGARVVSMSWDWADKSSDVDPGIVAAIRNNPNTLFVGVASNGSGSYDASPNNFGYYPCALNLPGDQAAGGPLANFICTTAIADAGPCGFTGRDVELAAYVDHGFTTLPAFQGDGFTPLGCSTSAAATTVDGVAAMLFGLDPEATGAQVKSWLLAGVHPDASLAGQVASGGQLDALGAVKALESSLWTPTLTAPAVLVRGVGTVLLSGKVDTRGIAGEHVSASVARGGASPLIATAPVAPDGSYALTLAGLPSASTLAVTVTAYADGIGAPSWQTPASAVLQAQRSLTISTAGRGSGRPTVGTVRVRPRRRRGRPVRGVLLASAAVGTGGLPTTWRLQAQRNGRRHGRRARVFVTVARGRLRGSAGTARIGATLHAPRGAALRVRLVAQNARGTATGRARRVRFPR